MEVRIIYQVLRLAPAHGKNNQSKAKPANCVYLFLVPWHCATLGQNRLQSSVLVVAPVEADHSTIPHLIYPCVWFVSASKCTPCPRNHHLFPSSHYTLPVTPMPSHEARFPASLRCSPHISPPRPSACQLPGICGLPSASSLTPARCPPSAPRLLPARALRTNPAFCTVPRLLWEALSCGRSEYTASYCDDGSLGVDLRM